MRFTYVLAVVVVATLHATGTALSTTKDSNHAAISNVVPFRSLDATEESSGRMLRKVKKDAAEDEIEEERGYEAFVKWLKQQRAYLKVSVKKRIPGTHEYKIYREYLRGKRNAKLMDRRNSNIRAGLES